MSEQGIKQTEGKTSYSEIDWSFIEKMAKCMNLNKGKYPPKNWQKPMNASLLLNAAQRHLIELQKDNLFDKENGAEHAVAVALNMMMYSYQQNEYSKSNSEKLEKDTCEIISRLKNENVLIIIENKKLKKELEAIKNSSKGECNVKAESSVDTQAIINSINDLYIKLNKPISPLRNNAPFPEFPYPHIKYHIKPPFVVNEHFSKPPFVDAKFDIRF